MESWKVDKIKSLKKEVAELHPLLKILFSKDSSINRFEYTHGSNEMGADFVLARMDQTFGDESYIGVIVKAGSIQQDFSDVLRQIDECEIERYFDSGKKKIYLTEIWILCNGSISNGAQRKIHEKYKNKNTKFIDNTKLIGWLDSIYPEYWHEIPIEVNEYLTTIHAQILEEEGSTSISNNLPILNIERHLVEIKQKKYKSKGGVIKKGLRYDFDQIVENNDLVIVEGGMGSGKSTLIRNYIKSNFSSSIFKEKSMIPVKIYFKVLVADYKNIILNEIARVKEIAFKSDIKKIIFFIDGVDESSESETLSEILAFCHEKISEDKLLKFIFTSRDIWTIEENDNLFKYAKKFSLLPLTTVQIYKCVEESCRPLEQKFKHRVLKDLSSSSSLMKALPRTPMTAVLLARVFASEIKDIPQTLPELYSKYIELALGRWDIRKGLVTEKEYPIILKVLSQVAQYMLDNELNEIAISEVKSILKDYIKVREGLPSVDELFNKIVLRSEIIYLNNQRQTFMFRHKSFAEYLYALLQKDEYGKNRPYKNPFDGRWLGVEYFYLGLIQDCGKHIDLLSKADLPTEKEVMLRILNLGDLMLAGYQTEYKYISDSIYAIYLEATKYFLDIKNGTSQSPLQILPELQLFGMFIYLFKDRYGYEFFKKGLEEAQIQCQFDEILSDDEKIILSFLIDTTRIELGEHNLFKYIGEKKSQLPWVVKLAAHHLVKDDNNKNVYICDIAKRFQRSIKKNKNLIKYIHDLYEKPLKLQIQKEVLMI